MTTKLYKYFGSERLDILRTRRVRFSPPGAFNDPFEMRPYVCGVSDHDGNVSMIDNLLQPDAMRQAYERFPLRDRLTFEEFLKNAQERRGHWVEVLEQGISPRRARDFSKWMDDEFNRTLGILSLSEHAMHLLMWAHYAHDHRGFVIGFDGGNPYFNRRRGEGDLWRNAIKVRYTDERPRIPILQADERRPEIFLTKSTEWSYEAEWRMICPLLEADQVDPGDPFPIHLFEIPPGAIVEIIIGWRMRTDDASRLIELVRESKEIAHVTLLRAVGDESRFELRAVPIHP